MIKVVGYDIECSGLKADFAFLLCAAFGEPGKKVKLLSLSQFGDGNPLKYEKELVKAVAEELSKADLLVSYYGKGFDRPFLNAKMLEYDLPPLPNIPEVDLYFTAKSNFAISRKSLANLAYYADIPNKKTYVEGKLWKAAQVGDRKALKEIEKHNIADVEVLLDVYEKLKPYVRTHPRVDGYDPCRFCGSKVQSRGYAISALKGKRKRFQCTNEKCLGWDIRPVPKNEQ